MLTSHECHVDGSRQFESWLNDERTTPVTTQSKFIICLHKVIRYQTDTLSGGEADAEKTRNAVVARYGTKKQRKETATHEWERRHFLEKLFFNRFRSYDQKSFVRSRHYGICDPVGFLYAASKVFGVVANRPVDY
ncbi:hypothetical protein TNCV_3912941 [Trichonephila clavipes]|nr:hypothetical protein TNCV_3912941 [Trichonephila clavipes]